MRNAKADALAELAELRQKRDEMALDRRLHRTQLEGAARRAIDAGANVSEAARALGVTRRTFYALLTSQVPVKDSDG